MSFRSRASAVSPLMSASCSPLYRRKVRRCRVHETEREKGGRPWKFATASPRSIPGGPGSVFRSSLFQQRAGASESTLRHAGASICAAPRVRPFPLVQAVNCRRFVGNAFDDHRRSPGLTGSDVQSVRSDPARLSAMARAPRRIPSTQTPCAERAAAAKPFSSMSFMLRYHSLRSDWWSQICP
jgi:hypothetical protein